MCKYSEYCTYMYYNIIVITTNSLFFDLFKSDAERSFKLLEILILLIIYFELLLQNAFFFFLQIVVSQIGLRFCTVEL